MIYLNYSSDHQVYDEVLNTLVSVENKYYGNCIFLTRAGKVSPDFYNRINDSVLSLLQTDKKGKETREYLSKKDICISKKSVCFLNDTPSKTKMTIYHDKKRALSSVRRSLSYLTTKNEINSLIDY